MDPGAFFQSVPEKKKIPTVGPEPGSAGLVNREPNHSANQAADLKKNVTICHVNLNLNGSNTTA